MTHKKNYKKILIVAAALVILFAPVGIAIKSAPSGVAMGSSPFLASSYSKFGTTLAINLAEASTTGPTTAGAAAGTTAQQNPSFLSCAENAVTCGVYYTAYVVNGIGGLGLMLGAWLVKLGLQFNDNIFNSPAVQTGFSVSLAVANLGFVLGIIIIAIATIIRNQTYGIKQLLWKLVVMAILVNFGLVITAPIVGFANDMSTYFINATSPSAATGGYVMYVNTMMTAFQPQQAILAGSSGSSQSATCSILEAEPVGGLFMEGLCNLVSSTLTGGDQLWQSTMALVFDAAFSFIAAFTFICLAVLLIVRYLMLGGLLIVLPLAWLTYVFPKFDNSYSKWWNEFIKWTFFPPIALFFIYLAFITAANSNTATQQGTATNAYMAAALGGNNNGAGNTTLEKGITTQTGVSGNVVAQAADEILLVGLMIMGLMFANSLAGKAGSTVVNGASTVTRAAAGYVGGRARKHATRAYQKMGGEHLNKQLQSSRIPLVGVLGRGMANVTERGSKDLVAERSKHLDLAGMDDDRLVAVTKGLKREEDQMAAVQEWQKRGKLDKIEKVGGTDFQTWLAKNQRGMGYMAQGKLKGDVDKAMMSNEDMRSLARVIARKGTDATQADRDNLNTAAEKFWQGKDKGDVSKMRPDWMFTDKPKFGLDAATLTALQSATTHGIAVETPAHFGSMAGKISNSKGRDTLVSSYKVSVEEGSASGKISPAEKAQIDGSLRKILNRLYTQIGGGDGGDPSDSEGGGTGGGAGAPPAH